MKFSLSFFAVISIGSLFLSCNQLKEYQALKEGYFVNEYALDLIQSKKMQLTRMPYLIPEFHFSKDTVRFFAGQDRMTATYTKTGNIYTLKDINDKTEYQLTMTSDSTFTLKHNFYVGNESAYNSTENKKTYTFKKSPYNFDQCLNKIAIEGRYEITFPTELAGKKIRFNSDGTIENFGDLKKYKIPYDGDSSQMLATTSGENSIFLESNTRFVLYAWNYDRNKKDITLYATTPPIPDIKGDQKITHKAFQLIKIE
jgi:hypothetical protein